MREKEKITHDTKTQLSTPMQQPRILPMVRTNTC